MDLRSREPWVEIEEEMDRPDAAGPDLDRALRELAWVHRWFGGRAGSRKALKPLQEAGRRQVLLDIGAGGTEILTCLPGRDQWHVVVSDFNRSICSSMLRHQMSQVSVVQSDAMITSFRPRSVDVVHCGLFLHHFSLQRGAALLRGLARVARRALVINDLHRHWVPWAATRLGAACLSRSRMVRHDAALSVARGFRRPDWQRLGDEAGLTWTNLQWVWPFRWVAVHRIDDEPAPPREE